MKRKILMVMAMISLIIMSLVGCGSADNKDMPAKVFSDSVKAVVEENSELAGYSMDELVEQENGLYTASAIVDGETIGAVMINVEDGEIIEFTFSFTADGPTKREYEQPIIASAMALDSALDYSTASDISDKIYDMLLFGEDPVEKNGYLYSAEWSEDDFIFVRFTK